MRRFARLDLRIRAVAALWLGAIGLFVAPAASAAPVPVEPPMLAEKVTKGKLPPVAERMPTTPLVLSIDRPDWKPGKHGGEIRTLMGRGQDTRQLVVYGYARLVGYDPNLNLVPDILESFEVEDGRIFTFRLRPGHKWSDGHPFTTEDFRYFWEEVAQNEELTPGGPPIEMSVDGELPTVEIINETTVRYTWSKPNPAFLPAIAGASPLFIYRPAHYMRQFHQKHTEAAELQERVTRHRQRSWASLHNLMDNLYKNDNPELPSLQPWINTTSAPSERFVFVRNPYFHRMDENGLQLPYIDRIMMGVASAQLIPAKTGAGESDLQARYLRFDNITFLKQNAERYGYKVHLWRTGKGAHLALYPNLNTVDPVWREIFRDVRFRRALSLAVNREEVNQVIYFGLALGGNNTLLPESPLYDESIRTMWANFDLEQANALLDEMGLARGDDGIRRLPDGRPASIIVETAGESTEETDVLQLVHDSWLKAGIKLYTKPLQREVLRNRIFAGETLMSVWSGLENGLATPEMSPAELAPTSQHQLQWPAWGQYYETNGQAGKPIDMPVPEKLMSLYREWREATNVDEQRRIWQEMLRLYADGVFSIGIIGGILQPVVVAGRLRNVPEEGFYNWDPGAHFGIYRPDTFWLDDGGR